MQPLIVRLVEEQFHRDTEGRPLREGRTPEALLQPDDIAYSECPYSGSRHAKRMNVSALRQTSAHWDEILAALATLQQGYADRHGAYGPDLRDLWYVSQLGSALPWFFIFRDGVASPPYAAALAKATLGTGILAQRAIVKMLSERWPPPPLTALSMMELAELSGTLVGTTEVCAAPDKMIVRFCEVLAPTSRAVTGTFDGRLDEVLTFGASYAAFKLILWLYYLARRFLYADIGRLDLLAESVEPPDFFVVEPPQHAAVPPAMRAAWFRQLGDLVVPLGDGRFVELARRLADTMGAGLPPRETWRGLDDVFAEAVNLVETNLGGRAAVSAELRDRLVGGSPRAILGTL